ncbi:unnamed protein product, partial [Mesorhabditis belari]|uniref:Glucosylceramidase n=1 Tax=Mesorhabditis belari TaxID=2138241 RepID=A0AAF3EWZ1_9BILA
MSDDLSSDARPFKPNQQITRRDLGGEDPHKMRKLDNKLKRLREKVQLDREIDNELFFGMLNLEEKLRLRKLFELEEEDVEEKKPEIFGNWDALPDEIVKKILKMSIDFPQATGQLLGGPGMKNPCQMVADEDLLNCYRPCRLENLLIIGRVTLNQRLMNALLEMDISMVKTIKFLDIMGIELQDPVGKIKSFLKNAMSLKQFEFSGFSSNLEIYSILLQLKGYIENRGIECTPKHYSREEMLKYRKENKHHAALREEGRKHLRAVSSSCSCYESYASAFVDTQFLNPCVPKYYEPNYEEPSMVCVCNASYCDEIASPGVLGANEAQMYTTNSAGKRMWREAILFENTQQYDYVITLDPTQQAQQIFGFGGTFTDAVGINLLSLNAYARQQLINTLFSVKGSEYTLAKVSIGSNAFSTRVYSNNDNDGDFNNSKFSLTAEDRQYKIPFILQAMAATNEGNLTVVASPYAPPAWMKSNGKAQGGVPMKNPYMGEYYGAYADYLIKFIQYYKAEGIPIWGLTIGARPYETGSDKNYPTQTLSFNATVQRDFIKTFMGIYMERSNAAKDTKLMIIDDGRGLLQDWGATILDDDMVNLYTAGFAIQQYGDEESAPAMTSIVHTQWRDKFFLYTEAATGWDPYDYPGVKMGWWNRADRYMMSLIENISQWVSGWIDYNLVLDVNGGPSWANVSYDAPIIVNSTAQEFYKQPTYYALAHFSKFIRPGATRIELTNNDDIVEIESVAVINPWGQRVLILLNSGLSWVYNVTIVDTARPNQFLNIQMGPREFRTILWDAPNHNKEK